MDSDCLLASRPEAESVDASGCGAADAILAAAPVRAVDLAASRLPSAVLARADGAASAAVLAADFATSRLPSAVLARADTAASAACLASDLAAAACCVAAALLPFSLPDWRPLPAAAAGTAMTAAPAAAAGTLAAGLFTTTLSSTIATVPCVLVLSAAGIAGTELAAAGFLRTWRRTAGTATAALAAGELCRATSAGAGALLEGVQGADESWAAELQRAVLVCAVAGWLQVAGVAVVGRRVVVVVGAARAGGGLALARSLGAPAPALADAVAGALAAAVLAGALAAVAAAMAELDARASLAASTAGSAAEPVATPVAAGVSAAAASATGVLAGSAVAAAAVSTAADFTAASTAAGNPGGLQAATVTAALPLAATPPTAGTAAGTAVDAAAWASVFSGPAAAAPAGTGHCAVQLGAPLAAGVIGPADAPFTPAW